MDASAFVTLALACAPQLNVDTTRALVSVESAFNPWAIGVVGGQLVRQPRNLSEALATAQALQANGWNYSVGLGQINQGNFERLGLTVDTAFDPCTNLTAMQAVLTECMDRVPAPHRTPAQTQAALRQALSCYYSGNFVTGFTDGYVRKVAAAAGDIARPSTTAQPKEKP